LTKQTSYMSSTVSRFYTPSTTQQESDTFHHYGIWDTFIASWPQDDQFIHIINFWSNLYRPILFYQLKESKSLLYITKINLSSQTLTSSDKSHKNVNGNHVTFPLLKIQLKQSWKSTIVRGTTDTRKLTQHGC
jgi:hypothetical protein